MNVRRSTFIAAGVAALGLAASAERPLVAQGIITGRVTGADTKQPLAESRVLVIGSGLFASTDNDGKYTVRNVKAGQYDVQVLRVGYLPQKKQVTVAVGETRTLDFELSAAVVQLQEVVTTATGEQRRTELGNAVSTLGDVSTKVEQTHVTNLTELMTAKSPGVIVLPQSTLGGAPTFRIRGISSLSLSNAPIFYLDGVRYSAGDLQSGTDTRFSLLNQLNPEEIEDVEIVKGPSAATLYGTNAANGVVLITTKKGRAGRTHWNWTAEQGVVDDRTNYPDMYANWGHSPTDPTKLIRCQLPTMAPTTCISDSLTHYNWLEDPQRTFVHLGKRSLYGAQVSGGTDAVRFFVSGDLDNETGPIRMPGYEVQRFTSQNIPVRDEWMHPSAQQKSSFRGNLSATLSPSVDLGFNVGYSKLDNRIPPESDLIIALYYVGMQNYGFKGPGNCPITFATGSTVPIGCLGKVLTDNNLTPLNDAYQWANGDIMQQTNWSGVQRTTASTNGQWRPFSWMQNDGTVGVDFASVNLFRLCRLNECPPQSATARTGVVTDNMARWRNFNGKLSSTSTYAWRPWLNFKTSFGGDYTNIETDTVNTGGTGLQPGATQVNAATVRSAADRQPTAVKTLGLYAQEEALLRDRLFVTGAIRTDQNSAFGTKFQRVYYPKLSASWLASDEPFFPSFSWLNQFRLRTAYGASGVQPGATTAFTIFTPTSVTVATKTTSGTDSPGLVESQLANEKLRPERSTEFEGGFEAQMISNRVHFDYTFYNKKTRDALVNVQLAPSAAPAQFNPLVNVGSTQNWGHEVEIQAQLYESTRFGWDVLLSGSHNSNKVLDLGIDPSTGRPRILRTASQGGEARNIPGLPINGMWYHAYTYNDANNDHIIQTSEVQVDTGWTFFGYRVPRDLFSVQNGFDFFNRALRISASFDYKGGYSTQDGANNFQCNTDPLACRETQDPTAPLWQQARAVAKFYGSVTGGVKTKTSAGYFMNGQFWKFRELSAAWQLPNTVTRAIRSQPGSSIVFAARNLHMWTNFTGIDPEANYGLTTNGTEGQNEFQTAAAPTYFTVRLNLKY